MEGLVIYTNSTIVTEKYDNPTRRLLIVNRESSRLIIAISIWAVAVNVLVIGFWLVRVQGKYGGQGKGIQRGIYL